MSIIQVNSLNFSYSVNSPVLIDVNLSISKGMFVGILGKNGSGKTTFINCLSGILVPNQGSIKLFDYVIKDNYDIYSKIGYMPQDYNFNQFDTCRDILERQIFLFGLSPTCKQIEGILDTVGLIKSIDTKVMEMSGGMKRRLMLARALVTNPELIILDEPSAGVDVSIRNKIWNYLSDINKNHHTTIVLSTNSVQEMDSLCSHIVTVSKGKVHGPQNIQDVRNKLYFQAEYEFIFNKAPANMEEILSELRSKYSNVRWNEECKKINLNLDRTEDVSFLIRDINRLFEKVKILDLYREPYSLSKLF